MISVAIAVVFGLGSGLAYAYLTSSGSGTARVTVGNDPPISMVSATGTPDSKLFPGGTADLTLTLDNPNDFPVDVVSIAPDPQGSIKITGEVGDCSVTGVTVNPLTDLSIVVVSGRGVVIHIPNAVSMSATSDSGCQGASFNIPVTIKVLKG
jgi:hypothetical protein